MFGAISECTIDLHFNEFTTIPVIRLNFQNILDDKIYVQRKTTSKILYIHMKIRNCDNEEIRHLLRERTAVLQSALAEADLDDSQLRAVERYKQLKTYQQDILYLSSVMPIAKLAELYCCSKTSIYNMLKKINKTLKRI